LGLNNEEHMGIIYTIHSLFGERVLPLLIIVVAIWLTIVWRPGQEVPRLARLFPVLVDIQVTLGIVWWIFGIVNGNPNYLAFPFLLHPLLGLLSAGVAHMAVRPRGPFASLGRWAPLAGLIVLMITVAGGIAVARSV
jgi:hypothetical protein